MQGLTEGRNVHFVMPNGEHRPAIIVRVWDKEQAYVNLTVFTDWWNDANNLENGSANSNYTEIHNGLYWATSVFYDEETKKPYTWHWIEPA